MAAARPLPRIPRSKRPSRTENDVPSTCTLHVIRDVSFRGSLAWRWRPVRGSRADGHLGGGLLRRFFGAPGARSRSRSWRSRRAAGGRCGVGLARHGDRGWRLELGRRTTVSGRGRDTLAACREGHAPDQERGARAEAGGRSRAARLVCRRSAKRARRALTVMARTFGANEKAHASRVRRPESGNRVEWAGQAGRPPPRFRSAPRCVRSRDAGSLLRLFPSRPVA